MDKHIKCKKILIVFFLLNCYFISFAGESINLQFFSIKFSGTKLTVKQALDELDQLSEINVFYASKEEFLKLDIVFTSRTMTVQKALDEIKQQAPVEIVFNNNHIIVKSRVIEKSYKIKGTVRDAANKEGLVAATIFLKGLTLGTFTDNQGNFSMSIKPGSYQLVCRFLGYYEKQIQINLYQDRNVDFFLDVEQNEINEVSILGNFREIENIEKGRNIESIDSKIIGNLNTNDVNDALHGRLNGVWNTKVSGAPGDHNNIRIRGINSFFGSSDPLYVVDGVIIPVVNLRTLGISDLNSHDVKSITVLKDASSTALYGYLGGNGVILIETKRGGGKTKFNFNVKQGFQTFTKRYKLMDTETFLSTLDSSDLNIETDFYDFLPNYYNLTKYPRYIDSIGNKLGSDDFQKEIFRNGSLMEYQLSGQGSVKTIDYYISGGYYKHDGIIVNSNYKKYTVTGNFSKNIGSKISLRLLYRGSHQDNKNNLDSYLGNNVIFKGINYEPSYRYTPKRFLKIGERFYYNDYWSPSLLSLGDRTYSPDVLFYEQEKSKVENTNSLNFVSCYQLNNEFSFRASISSSARSITYSNFIPSTDDQSTEYTIDKNLGAFTSIHKNIKEKFLRSKENFVLFNQQYEINYEKQLKNHGINATIRYRNYRDNIRWKIDSIYGVDINDVLLDEDIYLRGSLSIYGETGSVKRAFNSYIFNANYNYKKKYFISFITNFDQLNEGSFVDQKKIFSSVALNWDMAKENFLKFPDWIDAINFYLNWGQAGNYPLNSLSNDLYSVSSENSSSNETERGVIISNLANHNITHESVTETNFGSIISLFKERINFSADYYIKKNSDLLLQRAIPIFYGGGFLFQNIGEMKNSGIELSLELIPVMNKKFYWSTRAGFSAGKQYITKLDNGEPVNFNNSDILFPDFIIKENEVLGSISGYSYQGKWDDLSEADIQSKKYFQKFGLAFLKYDTLISDTFTENGKAIIGNSLPDFMFNWVNTIEYKNFSCEMLWYGAIGADKYNATKASTFITGTNAEVREIVLNSMRYHTNKIFYESSYFIEDASYIRLKTLSFTYSPTKKISSKISIKYTISFENLITLTHYSGYDPESTIYTNNNFSDNAVDMGAYPNPQSIYLNINLTF